jgi:hypothetical protein
MTRFVVKVICEATENNENFKGETRIYYKAKNASTQNPDHLKFFAKEYGYATKAAAIKGFKRELDLAEWETANGFWKDTCELLEVEI